MPFVRVKKHWLETALETLKREQCGYRDGVHNIPKQYSPRLIFYHLQCFTCRFLLTTAICCEHRFVSTSARPQGAARISARRIFQEITLRVYPARSGFGTESDVSFCGGVK